MLTKIIERKSICIKCITQWTINIGVFLKFGSYLIVKSKLVFKFKEKIISFVGAVAFLSDKFFLEIFPRNIYRIISKRLDIFPKLFSRIKETSKNSRFLCNLFL